MPTFEKVTALPEIDAARVWRWHASGAAFERLVPPWERLEVERGPARLEAGVEVALCQRVGPLTLRWRSRIVSAQPGSGFVDEAERSPFRRWRHEHWFTEGAGAVLGDRVIWEPPHVPFVRAWAQRRIEALFAWRHRVAREDLGLSHPRPLRVGVTGASGLVGRELTLLLRAAGHTVLPFNRGVARDGAIPWDPARGPDPERLRGLDAVVHLAGESVAQRWSTRALESIRASRVSSTEGIARAVAAAGVPVLVCASAVGFYGHRDEPVDETSGAGVGVLAEIGQAWEAAAAPAAAAGARVVQLRLGAVLSGRGGMLPRIASVFRTGAGGPLGHGRQAFPWVALDDAISMVQVALFDERWRGPVNAVAPEQVDHEVFCRALARTLRRPALARVPAAVVRAVYGQMGQELLLNGAWVRPARLVELGYRWRRPDLGGALGVELGYGPWEHGG